VSQTTTSLASWDDVIARDVVSHFTSIKGGLIPALHALQQRFGCIPKPAVKLLADVFNISRAEVYGVVTFYRDFHKEPLGHHVLKLCRAEACQSVGAVALASLAKKELALDWNETSADGRWTLEPVFCLGLCACGPAALLDGEPKARLDGNALKALIAEAGK
jgi:formate dehydrogenase subunit gamma